MRLRKNHSSVLVLCLAIVASMYIPSTEARKIRTKHSIPKEIKTPYPAEGKERFGATTISMESDSTLFCDRIIPSIRFYGFDKTATSSIESFFISNGLEDMLTGLEVEITYFDMKGRQLHKRNVRIDCDLPPGETRRTDIKSWDTQKSFYFHQSVKPKRQATPFNVTIRLLSLKM